MLNHYHHQPTITTFITTTITTAITTTTNPPQSLIITSHTLIQDNPLLPDALRTGSLLVVKTKVKSGKTYHFQMKSEADAIGLEEAIMNCGVVVSTKSNICRSP